MCQAYEGERAFMVARDRWVREKGYKAQKAGVKREAVPDRMLPGDDEQWLLGWDTAERGEEQW